MVFLGPMNEQSHPLSPLTRLQRYYKEHFKGDTAATPLAQLEGTLAERQKYVGFFIGFILTETQATDSPNSSPERQLSWDAKEIAATLDSQRDETGKVKPEAYDKALAGYWDAATQPTSQAAFAALLLGCMRSANHSAEPIANDAFTAIQLRSMLPALATDADRQS